MARMELMPVFLAPSDDHLRVEPSEVVVVNNYGKELTVPTERAWEFGTDVMNYKAAQDTQYEGEL